MANSFRVQTLNSISGRGLAKFPESSYTVGSGISEPDAILVRSARMHDMDIAPSVLAIGRAGAGTNNIPVAKMSARAIPVFNTPGANANAVKELVIAAMLMGARNLVPAIRFTDSLDLDGDELNKAVEAGKKDFAGNELPGRTLGIVGLGAIGSLVADAAIRLGMKVIGFDPEITVDAAWSLPSAVKRAHSIDDLLRNSDFISLHIPLIDATRNLINEDKFALMKNGTILLNFSREGIVNEDALLAAIAAKKISYLCDFPSKKLKGNPRVVMLPHLGASTEEAEDNCAVMVVNQIMDYLEHGNILNTVNFPNVSMPRESNNRLAVVNANVPNMLGQISTALAQAGINIHNMINKSRGEIAYTLVDIDTPATEALLAAIAAIPGVIRVRNLPLA